MSFPVVNDKFVPTNLWRGFISFLVALSAVQLVYQTDLVMVSQLGEAATAAYAIPLRVALFEMVLLMALGAVTSVLVAQAKNRGNAATVAGQALFISTVLGVLMIPLGLHFYPMLAYWIVADAEVAGLAEGALFWYALTSPLRMVAHVAVMALLALGEGGKVVCWRLGEVVLNGVLNTLLMFVLGMGFEGCFLATLLVMFFSSLWSLILLRRYLGSIRILPSWKAVMHFLSKAMWEGQRIFSGQLFALSALVLFASSMVSPAELSRLSAYSAGSALALLIFMPFLALMRSLSFQLVDVPQSTMRLVIAPMLIWGLPLSLLLSLFFFLCGEWLGMVLYNQAGDWWQALILALALSLPLRYFNAVQRGVLHSRKQFSVVSVVESVTTWSIGMPVIIAGLYWGQPLLACSYLVLPEFVICLWLSVSVRRMGMFGGAWFWGGKASTPVFRISE